MLIGEFITPVGDKNRVAIPKKLRGQLEDDIVITKGYEGCLILVDKSRWIQLISQINKYPLLGMNVRDTKRFLLGGAFDLDIDKQGRFVIPEALVLYGQLAEEVVFVGVGEWIEVWSNLNWQAKSDYLAKHSADIADRLGQS
ncbi:MAG: division/cell wall cluster transcriptional repressor MraZ [Candidatus Doudnabacteria bacterium]|nr:division/cell wall cluster transcriptional repressor MraZ [Candidatus Doudnabacteria bacterium]